MRIPLHLNPLDTSADAIVQRVHLNVAMAQLNPRGFRQPSKNSNYPTRLERMSEGKFDD